MTPEKRALIKSFTDNKAMSGAVLEFLMQHITPEGIAAYIASLSRDLPDAEYGARVKVRADSADLLNAGFAQLGTIASGKEGVQSVKNQSR